MRIPMTVECAGCHKRCEMPFPESRQGGFWQTFPAGWYVRLSTSGGLAEIACSQHCATVLDDRAAERTAASTSGIAEGIAALGDMTMKDAASLLHDLWKERKKK